MDLIQHNPFAIRSIPKNDLTDEMCYAAVCGSGPAIQHIPEVMLTHRMCMAAVKNSPFALKWIPEYLKDYDLCMLAVNNERKHEVLEYIPEFLKTYDMCYAAVSLRPEEIMFVPEKYRTLPMLAASVAGFLKRSYTQPSY
jgi:hypothetical protein